jgi:hypothetical protein
MWEKPKGQESGWGEGGRKCPAAVSVTHRAYRGGTGEWVAVALPGHPALYSSRQCASACHVMHAVQIGTGPPLFHPGLQCVLLFYPEDGGNRSFQNNDRHARNYTASQKTLTSYRRLIYTENCAKWIALELKLRRWASLQLALRPSGLCIFSEIKPRLTIFDSNCHVVSSSDYRRNLDLWLDLLVTYRS